MKKKKKIKQEKPDVVDRIVSEAAKTRKKITGILIYPESDDCGYFEMSQRQYQFLQDCLRRNGGNIPIPKPCPWDCSRCEESNRETPTEINERDIAFEGNIKEYDLLTTSLEKFINWSTYRRLYLCARISRRGR